MTKNDQPGRRLFMRTADDACDFLNSSDPSTVSCKCCSALPLPPRLTISELIESRAVLIKKRFSSTCLAAERARSFEDEHERIVKDSSFKFEFIIVNRPGELKKRKEGKR